MSAQKVDLYQPIIASRVGPPPVALRIATTPSLDMVMGGVPQNVSKIETYVLLSSLPTDLQDRVKTAVQALIAGM